MSKEIDLEKAIYQGLLEASEEKEHLTLNFKEENLRYIVMSKISDIKHFGVFPNTDVKVKPKLCFQTYYQTDCDNGKYLPDIASLELNKNGSKKKINPLVIELKTNASIPELRIDLNKANHYLKKVGNTKFKIAVVMTLGIPEDRNIDNYIYDLQEELNKNRRNIIQRKTGKKLLFAWYNPKINEPELFWLDQINIHIRRE